MNKCVGEYAPGATVLLHFNTYKSNGAVSTLSGSPVCRIYKDTSTSQHGTTYSPTVDFDSVTGLHLVSIDTSADATFYSPGSTYTVILQAGSVAGTSVVGAVVGTFRLSAQAAAAATVVYGTAASGTTTTCTAAVSVVPTVADQFVGRIVAFLSTTPTAALRGQFSDITDSTAPGGGNTVLTFTALTTAPSAGDIFVIL